MKKLQNPTDAQMMAHSDYYYRKIGEPSTTCIFLENPELWGTLRKHYDRLPEHRHIINADNAHCWTDAEKALKD